MAETNRLTWRELKTALFRTKHGFFLIFGTLFGGIPAAIFAVTLLTITSESELLRNGRQVNATLVAKHISSDSDSTSYMIVYEFVAENGRTYGGEKSVSNRTYYRLDKGSTFPLCYSPEDPFRVAMPGEGSVPRWVLLFLSLFIVVGAAFFAVGIRGLRHKLQTFGSGISTFGKNLGIQQDPSMQVNNRPCSYLLFEYDDFEGRHHTCRSSYLNHQQIASLASQPQVPVVYVSQRPEEADLDFERV